MLLRIAVRNTVRNRRRSAITLVAIALAVALLILARGTLNGLQAVLKEKVVYGQTGVLQVHKAGFVENVRKSPLTFGFPVDAPLLAKLRGIEGVQQVAPRITFASIVSVGETTVFSVMFGIDPELEYAVCPQKLREIGVGKPVAKGLAVLSPEVQRQLGVKMGDELTLMAPDAEGILNGGLVSVGGTMADNPAFSGDKKQLFLPLETTQALVRLEGQATEIAVRGGDIDNPDELKARVASALGPGYEVHTWRELAKFAVDVLQNQEVALGFVVAVFILIAVFGILNTMLMIVLSRTKEIGTMMAVGVKRREILVLVVAEAAFLGALGAVIGAVVGLALVAVVHAIGIPITVPGGKVPEMVRPVIGPAFVLASIAMAFVGAAIASVYPAYRASRMTPIEALAAL